jgi:hypothetical protein
MECLLGMHVNHRSQYFYFKVFSLHKHTYRFNGFLKIIPLLYGRACCTKRFSCVEKDLVVTPWGVGFATSSNEQRSLMILNSLQFTGLLPNPYQKTYPV